MIHCLYYLFFRKYVIKFKGYRVEIEDKLWEYFFPKGIQGIQNRFLILYYVCNKVQFRFFLCNSKNASLKKKPFIFKWLYG